MSTMAKSGLDIGAIQNTVNLGLMAGIGYMGYKVYTDIRGEKGETHEEAQARLGKYADALKDSASLREQLAEHNRLVTAADRARREREAAAQGIQSYELARSDEATRAWADDYSSLMWSWICRVETALHIPITTDPFDPALGLSFYKQQVSKYFSVIQDAKREMMVERSVTTKWGINPMKYVYALGGAISDAVGATPLSKYPDADWSAVIRLENEMPHPPS